MKRGTVVPFSVTHKGAVVVTEEVRPSGYVLSGGDETIIVAIDLESKYAEASGFGSGDTDTVPSVWLSRTERTLNLRKNTDPDELTLLEFPTLIGWDPVIGSVQRYTFLITFSKPRP